MKYSYNWLKGLSGTKKSVEEVAELFLTHSFEVEGIEDLSKGLDKVVVGEVLEVKKHPNADRLNVAKVKVKSRNSKVESEGENKKFEQTEKVLQSLEKIKKEADEKGIKFWVLGGLAVAFYAGQIYREHDDLDLITKTEKDRKKLLGILQKIGFSKIKTKKLTDKLSVDICKNEVEVEVVIGEYLNEFGLKDIDFEDKERELKGVKTLILSKRFIKSFKENQLKERNERKDVLDLEYLNEKQSNKSDKILQIVCGAPNLEVGQKVPVALVGAKLPLPAGNGKFTPSDDLGSKDKSDEQEKFFEIKQSKIRGVESFGMICAEDELGLGDEHEGIMVLTASQSQNDTDKMQKDAEEPVVGQSLAEYLHLNDKILDIDILPNRGHDCLGYNGVARELAALENIKFEIRNLKFEMNDLMSKFEKRSDLDVKIETENCSRYAGVRIKNIKIKPSPIWMQARLKASGMKPINNVVDITNYVMLETGQPLHSFDAKRIQATSNKLQDTNKSQIVVRQAEEGEKIVLLDEQELELTKDDVVITDGKKPVALAGVMGGLNSGVQDDTQEIILEGANFNSSSIRFTARRYNLQTDAAYRFERDIDPNFIDIAINRAVELLKELADAEVVEAVDIYPEPVKPWVVNLDMNYVRRLLGVDISRDEIKSILERLGIEVKSQKLKVKSRKQKVESFLICTIPTARRDLRIQEDLIEEVGRIYGYNNIKPKSLKERIQTPHRNEQRFFERSLKEMAVHRGFSEIKGYSFYSRDDAQALEIDKLKHIELLNPASPEQAILRNTLVVDLLKAGRKNLSYYKEIRIFEVGKIYKDIKEVLPREELFFSGLVTYKGEKGEQFYEAKGLLDSLLESLGMSGFYYDSEFSEEEKNLLPNLHPSRRALLKDEKGEVFGWLGEVDKKANKYFGFKKVRGAIWEIDVDKLREKLFGDIVFEPLAKFPFMERDLSMKVGNRLKVKEVEDVLFKAGGELIQDIDLFDLYLNKETGERSMAFHLVFGDKNKTLTAEEVEKVMTKIIKTVEGELDVEIRK